jgi:hypothetical protein
VLASEGILAVSDDSESSNVASSIYADLGQGMFLTTRHFTFPGLLYHTLLYF